jgi:nucleotide-binding universal stress UspA family protein
VAVPSTLLLPELAQRYLERARGRIPGVRGVDLVRNGEPGDRIVQVALEMNIDLVAMITHAHGKWTRWYQGSVAERVVRNIPLPILLRRPDTAVRAGPWRRILVPLDEFEASQAVLEVVKPLAARFQAELVLVHVRPEVHDPSPQWAMKGALHRAAGEGGRYQELADRLEGEDLAAWSMVAEGGAAQEILRCARELDVDLIAMSTHGRKGLNRMLVGSVTQEVLHGSDRPVLLFRPPKGAAHE